MWDNVSFGLLYLVWVGNGEWGMGNLTRVVFLQRCGFELGELAIAEPLNFRCRHHQQLPDCKKTTPVRNGEATNLESLVFYSGFHKGRPQVATPTAVNIFPIDSVSGQCFCKPL